MMTHSKATLFLAATAASVLAGNTHASSVSTSPLDGRWTWTWTPAQVKSKNLPPRLAGRYLVELQDGDLTRLLPHPVLRGAHFTTQGDVATFVFPRGVVALVPGRHYVMHWSIYRDRLTWSKIPGRAWWGDLFLAVPWTRVH
jgi:hypothetical protein